jgi:2-polyprenyl-6-hydroxyphenyl methylase/3-demethylubiquinone-9 3-methyltransferase
MDSVEWHERIGEQFSARYENSAAFRERLAVWSALVEQNVRLGAAVLDAGCGPGALACVAAQRARVTAVDASPAMLAISRRRAAAAGVELDTLLGSIGDADLLAGRRFDVILCSSVLEYMDDLDAALDWLILRLAPGGALLASMPNGAALYRRAERLAFRLAARPRYYAFVRHTPSLSSFAATLARHGLTADESRFYAGPRSLRLALPGRLWTQSVENLYVVVARRSESAWRWQSGERPRPEIARQSEK